MDRLLKRAGTLAAFLMLGALGACAHGPDYVRPTATTADAAATAVPSPRSGTAHATRERTRAAEPSMQGRASPANDREMHG